MEGPAYEQRGGREDAQQIEKIAHVPARLAGVPKGGAREEFACDIVGIGREPAVWRVERFEASGLKDQEEPYCDRDRDGSQGAPGVSPIDL